MSHSQLDVEITDAMITALETKVTEIEAQYPFLLNLTLKEIKELAKMGKRRQAIVQKLLDIALQHPQILPGSFSTPKFQRDFKAAIRMKGVVRNPVLSLLEKIDETGIALGNEAYEQALKVKGYLELANRTDAGLDELAKEVQEMFEQVKEDDQPQPQPAVEPAVNPN